MGWLCYLYVLRADKYHNLLRPVLREIYGKINRQKMVKIQKDVINTADVLANLENMIFKNFKQIQRQNYGQYCSTPLQIYLRQKGSSEFWGTDDQNSQKQRNQILKQWATPVYQDVYGHGTGLMRISDMVHTIDSFDKVGSRVRICNIEQVQNQVKFLEAMQKAYKGIELNASHYFKDTKETRTVFNDVLALMKKEKEDHLLYYGILE